MPSPPSPAWAPFSLAKVNNLRYTATGKEITALAPSTCTTARGVSVGAGTFTAAEVLPAGGFYRDFDTGSYGDMVAANFGGDSRPDLVIIRNGVVSVVKNE